MINTDDLSKLFRYDPQTGVIYRKKKNGSEEVASHFAKRQGRNRVRVFGKWMYAYRVGWALYYGKWPSYEIDHINGVSCDDRISNLRDVPRKTNQENVRRATSRSITGVLGVSKDNNRYKTSINTGGGKMKYIGSFKTIEEAKEAFIKAKRTYHKGCTI
jgi:hypothetical protein